MCSVSFCSHVLNSFDQFRKSQQKIYKTISTDKKTTIKNKEIVILKGDNSKTGARSSLPIEVDWVEWTFSNASTPSAHGANGHPVYKQIFPTEIKSHAEILSFLALLFDVMEIIPKWELVVKCDFINFWIRVWVCAAAQKKGHELQLYESVKWLCSGKRIISL